MNRLLLIALSVVVFAGALPRAAKAQTVSVALTYGFNKKNLSRGDCSLATQEHLYQLSWTSTLLVPTGAEEVVYFAKSNSCAENEFGDKSILRGSRLRASDGRGFYPETGSTTEEEKITPRALFDLVADDCGGTEGIESTVYLCVKITPGGGTTTNGTIHNSVAITLDSKAPAVPVNVSTTSLDGQLRVNWEMPDNLEGATGYHVRVRDPSGALEEVELSGSATRTTVVDRLANGTEYTVTVSSFDSAGTENERRNESAESAEATGTPMAVEDFYERYRRADGTETGGCAEVPMASLAIVGLLALGRRRRRNVSVAFALGVVATSMPVRAEEASSTHSSRRYTFSLRTGSYTPSIDSEPALVANGATPYADIFGSGTALLTRAQFDVDVFDRFGRIRLGVMGGFWQSVGKGRFEATGEKSDQTVLLDVWPIGPVLTYSADFVDERLGVPLVPFVRLGYGFAHWVTYKGDSVSSYKGDEGSGWGQGLEYAAGLQWVLDSLEPDKAASLDQDFGINSTAIFLEWDRMEWQGAHGLRLQGSSVAGGLQFAF